MSTAKFHSLSVITHIWQKKTQRCRSAKGKLMNQKERCTCNMFGRNAMQNSKAKCMDAIFQKFKT